MQRLYFGRVSKPALAEDKALRIDRGLALVQRRHQAAGEVRVRRVHAHELQEGGHQIYLLNGGSHNGPARESVTAPR